MTTTPPKDTASAVTGEFDISIVRPEMRDPQVQIRGRDMTAPRLQAIKKGLHALHTLEIMATNIYKFQITKAPSALNRQLIAAMCNEMTHIQDFQVKLYEYGFRPSLLRWTFWFVGMAFGLGSRILGVKAILKTGVWVESKAVHHYAALLETIDWDDDTRKIIRKDQADEHHHVSNWRKLLQEQS